jgi:hypothetical protein
MNPSLPKVGDFVLHQTGIHYGEVVGYGERQMNARRRLILKVKVQGQFAKYGAIVMEDFASNWLRRSDLDQSV